jgi:prophage tail gpP-like protein
MPLQAAINGNILTNLKGVYAKRSLDDFANNFRIVASGNVNEIYPIRSQDTCEVFANGRKIVTGIVEKINGDSDDNTYQINCEGRSRTSAVYDSTLSGKIELGSNITLEQVIQEVLKELSLNNTIRIINNAGEIAPFVEGDVVASKTAERAFNFIELYARQRQVLLITNPDGNIELFRGTKENTVSKIFREINGQSNNSIRSSIMNDSSQRYRNYVVYSQAAMAQFNFEGLPENLQLTSPVGMSTDDEILPGRQRVRLAERQSNAEACLERAIWERNTAIAKSFRYTAYVPYFNDIFEIGDIIPVKDEFFGIEAQLVVASIDYRFTLEQGDMQVIQFVEKDAFTNLQAQRVFANSRSNSYNQSYFNDLVGVEDGN